MPGAKAGPVIRQTRGTDILTGRLRHLAFIALFTLICTGATASERDRERFLRAEAALDANRRAEFLAHLEALRDYPLFPYLEYRDLRGRLDTATAEEIQGFLVRHEKTPLAWSLRRRWLDRLAGRGAWQDFLAAWRPNGIVRLQCLRLRALLATGEATRALEEVPDMWLHGRSRPSACDPVFDAWRAAGRLTPELARERAVLAIGAGQQGLSRYLRRYLTDADRAWVDHWLRTRRDPRAILKGSAAIPGDTLHEAIVVDALRRLVRVDPDAADNAWNTVLARHPLSAEARAQALRRVALTLAYRLHRDAGTWLARVPEEAVDEQVRHWRVNTAVRAADWPTVLASVDGLDAEERVDGRWRYWHGRALEETGYVSEGRAVLQGLSQVRSYHGFMAADRVGSPYRFDHRPLVVNEARLREVERRPGARRARELFLLGRGTEARREWYHLTRDMSDPELEAASMLAYRWGWHDRAIITISRADHRDDLDLRFPLAYREPLEKNARHTGLTPAWLFAVVRQESAFGARARSPKGALGLMQVMPDTGRLVTRRVNARWRGSRQLLDPAANVRIGSTYLSQLLKSLGDHPALATAAYNAGPHRVRRWLPEGVPMDAERWIDSIPFKETRRYVRRVFAYTAIYERRLGLEPTPLRQRLTPVPASLDEKGRNQALYADSTKAKVPKPEEDKETSRP